MRPYYGLSGVPNQNLAAAAFATAFAADLADATTLKAALLTGKIGSNGLSRIILRDLDAGRAGKSGVALFPNVRKVAGMILRSEGHNSIAGGLGQWDTIANLVGAAAGAASKIYSAVEDSAMQKELLKLQEQKNQTMVQIAQLQAQQAQAQLAAANVVATGVPSSSPVATVLEAVGGWPVLGVASAAVALAFGSYFALRRR